MTLTISCLFDPANNHLSETVSAALIFIFHYLARDPAQVEKLRLELDTLEKKFDNKTLQALPFLNAVIHETLRLHPPVPSGLLRETPPEGIVVAGRYIPGTTTVVAPNHTISRRKQQPLSANHALKA